MGSRGTSLLARVLADELGDVGLARRTGAYLSKKLACPLQAWPGSGDSVEDTTGHQSYRH